MQHNKGKQDPNLDVKSLCYLHVLLVAHKHAWLYKSIEAWLFPSLFLCVCVCLPLLCLQIEKYQAGKFSLNHGKCILYVRKRIGGPLWSYCCCIVVEWALWTRTPLKIRSNMWRKILVLRLGKFPTDDKWVGHILGKNEIQCTIVCG